MRRAKQVLLVAGVLVVLIGSMGLPFASMNPKALSQSLFVHVAATGAFTRPGLILIGVGLGCLALAALLPSSRD